MLITASLGRNGYIVVALEVVSCCDIATCVGCREQVLPHEVPVHVPLAHQVGQLLLNVLVH